MRKVGWLLAFVIGISGTARADESAVEREDATPVAIPVLEEVLVTGEQPGPGLWRVSRGDHSLWILGSHSPLPSRMRWGSAEVEARVAEAGVVLAPPTVRFDVEGGRVRALFLLPSLLGARKNPDGATLEDVVAPDVYARWRELKARHLPRHRGVERWRPLFAAQKLYEEAVEDMGLRFTPLVWSMVKKAADRYDVDIVQPSVDVRIEAPRQTLKAFKQSPLDDQACFALTLERLELDLKTMGEQANAWAIGDLEHLAALTRVDPTQTCIDAVIRSSVVTEQGFDDLPARVRAAWLEAAESALSEHAASFAVLPIRLLLADDGVLADLTDRGYEIEAPL